MLEDLVRAVQTGSTPGSHMRCSLQRHEVGAALRHFAGDIAVRDPVAQANDHGLECNENRSYLQVNLDSKS